MRYEEYKETLEAIWFSSIPENWRSTKMREVFSERNTKVSDKDYPALSVGKMGVVPQLDTAVKTDNGENRKLICKGDFAINSRSDRKGSSGISEYDGSSSLIITVLKPHHELNGKFYHYLLRSHYFVEEFYRNGHGLVSDLWTTKWDEMRNIYIPVPPREEQDQIVRYLDWKVSAINKLIHGYQKQIKLLEERKKSLVTYMVTHDRCCKERKESEIYWLDSIPKNWRVTRLKYVLRKQTRPIPHDAELLVCSNHGNVVPRGDNKLGLVAENDDIYQGVKKGDLLIHGMDTWHGAIAISQYNGMCTPVVHVCTSTESSRFICYYLRMMAFTKVFKAISNGVRQNTSDFRSWDKAGSLLIALPSFEEQERIADILDSKLEAMNFSIERLRSQIQVMQEYRTRLISDVVTGQIDVRNVAIPEYEVETEENESNDEEGDFDE